MTRTISLYFREEGEENNVTNGIHNTTSDNTISSSNSSETNETNRELKTEVEELRNYEQESTSNINVSFEPLEIKINELLTSELVTHQKLDELIMIQKQNYIIAFNLFLLFIFLTIMLVIYKVISSVYTF